MKRFLEYLKKGASKVVSVILIFSFSFGSVLTPFLAKAAQINDGVCARIGYNGALTGEVDGVPAVAIRNLDDTSLNQRISFEKKYHGIEIPEGSIFYLDTSATSILPNEYINACEEECDSWFSSWDSAWEEHWKKKPDYCYVDYSTDEEEIRYYCGCDIEKLQQAIWDDKSSSINGVFEARKNFYRTSAWNILEEFNKYGNGAMGYPTICLKAFDYSPLYYINSQIVEVSPSEPFVYKVKISGGVIFPGGERFEQTIYKEVSDPSEVIAVVETYIIASDTWGRGGGTKSYYQQYNLTASGYIFRASKTQVQTYKKSRWRIWGVVFSWILNITIPGLSGIISFVATMIRDAITLTIGMNAAFRFFPGQTWNVGGSALETVYVPSLEDISYPPKISLISVSCEEIDLSVESRGDYNLYQDGKLIASNIPFSQKTYNDKNNIACHKTYIYQAEFQGAKSSPLSVYTFHLPECSFSADKQKIVFPGKATLSWNCQDAENCSISTSLKREKGGLENENVNSKSGALTVFPQEKTDFVLTCGNIDGKKSFINFLDVLTPGYKEVNP